MVFVSVIVVAGGSSRRMGGKDKLYMDLCGKTVLRRAVEAFERNALVSEIVVVSSPENLELAKNELKGISKLLCVVQGGETRSQSVSNGLKATSRGAEYIAIHDGARPLISDALISASIEGAVEYGACAPGILMCDTLKRIDDSFCITGTQPRDGLVSVQTPQVFESSLYRAAAKRGGDETDDCALVEKLGRKIMVVAGDRDNIKITTPADEKAAREIIGRRCMRIGHGYDVHRLAPGRKLIIGGVEIPFEKGLLGHSDADVLTHALCDALLGAAALGDIGKHFPDSDGRYKDADSVELLRNVCAFVRNEGYEVANADVTLVCERPKIKDYIEKIRNILSGAMNAAAACVSVKATTEEGLGFTGAGEGIAAHAVVLLRER